MPERQAEVVPPPRRGTRNLPRSTAVATVILGISMAVAGAFVVQHGGLFLPGGSGPTDPTAHGPSPAPGANPTPTADGGDEAALGPPAAAGNAAPTGEVAGATSGGGAAVSSVAVPPESAPASASGPAVPTTAATLVALTAPPSQLSSSGPEGPSGPKVAGAPSPSGTAPTASTGPVGAETATASRLDLLTRCPDRADCDVYVVRRGDNLSSIVRFFGVDLTRVRAMNPSIGSDSVIRIGQHLLIPPPTR